MSKSDRTFNISNSVGKTKYNMLNKIISEGGFQINDCCIKCLDGRKLINEGEIETPDVDSGANQQN